MSTTLAACLPQFPPPPHCLFTNLLLFSLAITLQPSTNSSSSHFPAIYTRELLPPTHYSWHLRCYDCRTDLTHCIAIRVVSSSLFTTVRCGAKSLNLWARYPPRRVKWWSATTGTRWKPNPILDGAKLRFWVSLHCINGENTEVWKGAWGYFHKTRQLTCIPASSSLSSLIWCYIKKLILYSISYITHHV